MRNYLNEMYAAQLSQIASEPLDRIEAQSGTTDTSVVEDDAISLQDEDHESEP